MPAHFSWRRRHLITRSRSVVLRGHAGKARRADNLAVVSGRVRPARSDAVRVFGTGVGCRGAGVEVRYVLSVVRQTSRCLTDRRNGRYDGRGVVSRGPGGFRVGSSSGWSRVLGIDAVGGAPHCDFANEVGARVSFPVVPRLARRHFGRRGLGPGRRGRRLVGIALPGSRPRRDGPAALVECPGARAADLGW